jgi:hypothetical protein
MTTPITPPMSSTVDFDFVATVTLIEEWGLSPQDAFFAALLLRSNGISAIGAVKLFQAASRWLQ